MGSWSACGESLRIPEFIMPTISRNPNLWRIASLSMWRKLFKVVPSKTIDGADFPVVGGRHIRVASSGKALRLIRKNEGYSVRNLARESGLSAAYISQVERGLRPPTSDVFDALASCLELSSADYRTLYQVAAIEYLESKGWDTSVLQSLRQMSPSGPKPATKERIRTGH